MKTAITTPIIFGVTLLATPALADPGHFAEAHGHSHWLAAGALALATVIGGVALWKIRTAKVAAKARADMVAERKA